MLYVSPVPGATASSPESPTVITGIALARCKRGQVERAFEAADLVLGRLRLDQPTIRQSAMLSRVCVVYAAAAIKIDDDPDARAAALAGERGLLRKPAAGKSLASHILRSSPEDLRVAAETVGIDRIWDLMIAPAVA
jgi:hypothetical protein